MSRFGKNVICEDEEADGEIGAETWGMLLTT